MNKTEKIRNKTTFIPKKYRPRVKGEKIQACGDNKLKEKNTNKKRKKKKSIICVYLSEDCSQTKVIQKYIFNYDIEFLTYDEIGYGWNFSYYNGKLLFYTDEYIIEPIGIYNRPYCPELSHKQYSICDHFLRVMDLWKGRFIGPKAHNFHNSSKPYQVDKTIRNAVKQMKNNKFTFPRSYCIKGDQAFYKKLLSKEKNLIVKSLSGIRSEVVTQDTFAKWDKKGLTFLPTFFQEACYGPDIRLHWVQKETLSIKITSKEGSIDYRYANHRGPYIKYDVCDALQCFANQVADIEQLSIIGIDFIVSNNKYVCLECNPNPGWAGFHRQCGDEPLLAKILIDKLVE